MALSGEIAADVCLCQVVDRLATTSPLLDPDIPLDEYGAFSFAFLSTVVDVLRATPSDLPEAIAAAKSDLAPLFESSAKQPSLQNLLNAVFAILDDPSQFGQLTEIARAVYCLLDCRLRRVQAQLVLAAGTNRVDPINRVSTVIAKMMQQLEAYKLAIQPADVFLLTKEGCRACEKYLNRNRKPFGKCSCQARADVYAVPCNCPCYCSECWEWADKSEPQLCPSCDKPVKEFVVVQHD
jgi:hypothetical protein